jgi:hypothetical protein
MKRRGGQTRFVGASQDLPREPMLVPIFVVASSMPVCCDAALLGIVHR